MGRDVRGGLSKTGSYNLTGRLLQKPCQNLSSQTVQAEGAIEHFALNRDPWSNKTYATYG